MTVERTADWAERAVADARDIADEEPAHLSPEQRVLARIDRARRRQARVTEERVTLAHGAGGKATQTLVEGIFLEAYPSRRFQSAWMGILVHSLQSVFVIIVVLALVLE